MEPSSNQTKYDQLGFYLACLYAFFAFSMDSITNVCAVILLLNLLISKQLSLKAAKQDKLHWLLLLSIIIPVMTWVWSVLSGSEFQAEYPKKFEYLQKLFIFLLIGYFLRHSTNQVVLFGLAFIFGLLISPLISGYGYGAVIDQIASGGRVSLGTINIISVSATFAIALIFSLTVLLPRAAKLKQYRWPAIGLLALLISLLLLIIVTTETRGVFIGLAVCTVVATIHLAYRTRSKRYSVLPGLIVMIAAGFYLSANDKPITKIQKPIAAIDNLVSSGLSSVPQTSSGLRIHMWAAGLDAFLESPILGHGGHAAKEIVQSAPYISEHNKGFQHLHNSYIDLLARFGIGGLLWYLALLLCVWRTASQLYHSGVMGRDLYYFFNYFLVFWLVINAFESFIVVSRGTMMFTIAVAMIYSYRYRMILATDVPRSAN